MPTVSQSRIPPDPELGKPLLSTHIRRTEKWLTYFEKRSNARLERVRMRLRMKLRDAAEEHADNTAAEEIMSSGDGSSTDLSDESEDSDLMEHKKRKLNLINNQVKMDDLKVQRDAIDDLKVQRDAIDDLKVQRDAIEIRMTNFNRVTLHLAN
jgi:hypothetical protein